MDDLPESVVVGSAVFSRVDSDDSLACWTSIIDVQGVGDSRPVSLVIEPATVPESAVCALAATVMARFGEFAEVAADYLRQQLRGPQFGLRHSELVELDATESLFGEPEAVIWADGTWLLRFAESRLEMAYPFGIGVLFEGTTPYAVEDLSGAEPA
ncbi:hypothetical protein [Rhodococcus sp. MEB032]|uniref:hypothetical protein n=1 Tax=Rhodococcus sp. MEB032 TaxID=3040322 RepID=UPI0025503CE6|nr:hypothetical protein [Rhodococcus sp. MEB032]